MKDTFSSAAAFNQDISSWNVSGVTNMQAMFSHADSFDQNLGKWYVVPDIMDVDRGVVPVVVGTISAQNSVLDGHSPTYGIGTGGDSALFEIVSGNGINMTAVQTKSAYGVNVTASGADVFENGNNWRMLDVTVTGQAEDTTPPTIFLRGLFSSVEIEVLTPYMDEGADCEDDVDGVITPTVVNTVNVNQVGTYTVTYSCSDAANNDAEDVSRSVTVSDTTPPVITLIGPNPVYVTVGTSYTDAGATCTDNYDGAITPQGGIGVDPSQVGTYTVTYNCFDSEGNNAPLVSRTVIVQEESDTTPPTFVSSGLDGTTGVLTITFSEDIDVTPATQVVPAKIHVRESGSYTGGITLSAGELGTAADGATISFTLAAPHRTTVAGLAAPELTIEPGAVRDTSDNLIVGTFDVSTAVFVDAFSVSSQEATPEGMAFSSDGAKMFVVGSGGDEINEYALSAAFDASTAVFVDATSVLSKETAPTGMAFSNDGAKMFIVGVAGDDINEYALSTAFDASTATFVDAFSVSSQDSFPTDVAFSSDGAKMFVVGGIGKDINEYTLSTAFDVSTATFADVTFSVSEQELSPRDVAFSNDGAKMFVIGSDGDEINEYALSAAFDASTAVFVDAFSVSSEEDSPQGMAFSSDGAKMFVVGFVGDDVNEYDLHSVYPITVTDPPPTFVSSELDSATGALTITFSEEIDATPATNVVPTKIHIRESGSYTGGITLAAGELGTAADGATISLTLTVPHLATVAGLATPELTIEPGAVRDTSDNLIVGTFDVSTAVFVDATSVSSQEIGPTGMAFSSDGAKMFVIGSDGDEINEYTLSTAFDASTATHVDAFSVSSQDNFPTGMAFSNDGAKMFVVGNENDSINEYTLSAAFDASTATFVDTTPVSQDPTPQDVAFSNGGTKMFVVGLIGAEINEYTLSTAFDASTATFVDTTSVSSKETGPTGMAFSNDGAKMFVVGSNGDSIYEYALSTAFDASTATHVDTTSVSSQETSPQGMSTPFSSDGRHVCGTGRSQDHTALAGETTSLRMPPPSHEAWPQVTA